MTNRQASILVMVGGALVAAGSLLPWATLSTGFGSVSVNGIEGDGVFTVFLGGAVALLGFLAYAKSMRRFVTVALAGVALGIGGNAFVNLSERFAGHFSDVGHASIGIGLYLVLAGAVVAIVGGYMAQPVPEPSG